MSNKKTRICLCVLVSCLLVVALVPILSGQQTDQEKARLAGSTGTKPQGKVLSMASRPKSPVPTSSRTLQGLGIPAGRIGVFALHKGSIKLVDAKTFVMSGPFLSGQLGSESSALLDVVLTKNGKTALLSSYGSSTVYFVDLANASNPMVRAGVNLGMLAEDIALAPNEKFAAVTSNGQPRVASLDVKKRTLVQELDLTPFGAHALAVAIAKDNETVITGFSAGRAVNYLLMNPKTGALSYVGGMSVAPARPINVAISPNGKTAFAVSEYVDSTSYGFGPLFSIAAPGSVVFSGWLTAPSADIKYAHAAVFSKDSKKLYVLGGLTLDADGFSQQVVYVYNVTAPGVAIYTGTAVTLYDFVGSATYFGVDVMGIENSGKYLFVSNCSTDSAENRIAVVDLRTNAHVLSLIPCGEDDFPNGIAFRQY